MAAKDAGNDQDAALDFAALPRPTQISAHIAEAIRERIVAGTIPLGARLPSESVLSRDFAVSRPTVREALAALQFVGLVESRRGYGTVVVAREPTTTATSPAAGRELHTLSDAVDLLEARLVLEPAAIALAAGDPDLTALEHAGALIDGMVVAIDDAELGASSDIRVHHALLDVCRNAWLRDAARALLELALDPMLLTTRTHAWSSSEIPHDWVAQHQAVHAAISSGDPTAAKRAAQTHLGSVADGLAIAVRDEPDLVVRVRELQRRHQLDTAPALTLAPDNPAEPQKTRTQP